LDLWKTGTTPYNVLVTQVSRALEQIEAIHEHLARGEVYRGWRSVPVALSGLAGLLAAMWQSTGATRPIDQVTFTTYWLAVGVVALGIGCAEIVWHYVMHANATERRRSRCVLSQFLPALVAGFVMTLALVRLDVTLVALLPGLWAMLFGVGIFAARPYLPASSGLVATYYWAAGLLLLSRPESLDALSPWTVGGTFGGGQLLAAIVLYFSLERVPRPTGAGAHISTEDPRWKRDAQ